MKTEGISLDSPIEEKINWAEACYRKFGNHLLQEEAVLKLLDTLTESIRLSHREMKEAGISRECEHCEKEEGGSCCGAGLENHYDGDLLLINLLMGSDLPRNRHDPQSCFFLREGGCLLQARHVICINYLCKKITDRIDDQKINLLREREGRELEALFLFQERIKKILREMKPPEENQPGIDR